MIPRETLPVAAMNRKASEALELSEAIRGLMLWGLVALLLVAMVVGALSRALVGGTWGGCLVSMVAGLIGAVVGGYLSRALNAPSLLPLGGIDIVWGTIGAVLFLLVLRMLTPK